MTILAQHLTATVVMTSAALIKKKCPQHCTTSGGKLHLVEGHMVHERSTTRSEFSALDKSHCIGTHRQEW